MLSFTKRQVMTTPKVRAASQARGAPAWRLTEQFGTTEQTVYKWRHRDGVADRIHTPKRLQITLTPAQEAVAVALRRTLLVSVDDLLAVVREFLNLNASRSSLNRCLRQYGVGDQGDLKVEAPQPKRSAINAYVSGYTHLDVNYLPQMAGETSRRYLLMATDRPARSVSTRTFKTNTITTANARCFPHVLERVYPMSIRTVPLDNSNEFTGRLFGLSKLAVTGEHAFNTPCVALEIEHRLTPLKSPQSKPLSAIGTRTMASGVDERFKARIEQMMQRHHFRSDEDRDNVAPLCLAF